MRLLGYCDKYVDYMQKKCKASCTLCHCGVLSETMDRAKAINVVLVGSKFGQNEMHWKAQVDRIYGIFDAYPPLHADAVEQLNVYYVRTPVPGDDGTKCWYGCGGIDRLLCCDAAFFERHVTGKCGTGLKYQITVVHNDKKYGGSGGRIGTTSIASSAPLIAIHELGHSMFGLGDEYTSNNHGDKPNCDRSAGCTKWADMIGQFEGAACLPGHCGGGEYNAPGEKTIMQSLWWEGTFGPVNERITCCTYLLETTSYPKYCKPFDSGSFDLKSYCETYVWKRQVSLLESSEEVVTRTAQGSHYVHVDEPVEWQLVKTKQGKWRCGKLGVLSPGEYPRDEVEGDLELPRTGDRILVEVLAEDWAGDQQKSKKTVLRKLFFNEFDTVDIPPHMEDEPDDEVGGEASEERSDINVILSQGEVCRIARQPKLG